MRKMLTKVFLKMLINGPARAIVIKVFFIEKCWSSLLAANRRFALELWDSCDRNRSNLKNEILSSSIQIELTRQRVIQKLSEPCVMRHSYSFLTEN